MALRIEKPKTAPHGYRKLLLVIFLVIAAILITLPFLQQKPAADLAFEILSFEGDAQIYDAQIGAWRAPARGEEIRAMQKLRTGSDGVINFQTEGQIRLRLREDSLLENKECGTLRQKEIYKFYLDHGVLFGATTKTFDRKEAADKAALEVRTPGLVADVHGGLFRIQGSSGQGGDNKVGVLRGSAEVFLPSLFFRKSGVRVRGLEKTVLIDGVLSPPARVSPEEWAEMKEAYELIEKTAVMEAQQIDLSKDAGTLFAHVFDHGTFFTPKVGYAGREFYKDPDSGEVYLDVEYDVFPAGSFDGVYMKARDLDAAQYEGLSFDVRRNGEEGFPDSFSIELKSKGNVVRRFAPRGFLREWTPMQFEFHAQKTTPISEVVFVFTNARAGEAKKGMLVFRNINLIPRKTPLSVSPKAELKVATPAPMAQETAPSQSASQPQSQVVSLPKEIPLE